MHSLIDYLRSVEQLFAHHCRTLLSISVILLSCLSSIAHQPRQAPVGFLMLIMYSVFCMSEGTAIAVLVGSYPTIFFPQAGCRSKLKLVVPGLKESRRQILKRHATPAPCHLNGRIQVRTLKDQMERQNAESMSTLSRTPQPIRSSGFDHGISSLYYSCPYRSALANVSMRGRCRTNPYGLHDPASPTSPQLSRVHLRPCGGHRSRHRNMEKRQNGIPHQ